MENTLTNPQPYPFTHDGVTSPQKAQIFQGEFGARADLPHVRVAIMLAFITPSDNPEPLSRLKSPVGHANSIAPHCCLFFRFSGPVREMPIYVCSINLSLHLTKGV